MSFTDITKNPQKTYVVSEPGEHVFFLYNVSGRFTFDVQCEGANVWVLGAFVGREAQNFELHTVQHHAAPRSVSNLLVKGAFFDASRFVYSGLIQIDKAAQQTDAVQTNRNLILSPKAVVTSEPYLEILADDVKCKHASTTGRVNPEQLYYAETRGVSRSEAENMIAAGFIRDVFLQAEKLGCATQVAEYQQQALSQLSEEYVS